MKKYLIRAGYNPLISYSPLEAISRNLLGGNSGNLMFSYGVMNVLSKSDVMFVPTYYKRSWSDEDVDYINQQCQAFILPLADAFRQDFVPQLKEYIDLIKKLTIPCIVIGVGLRASFEPDLNAKFPFDDIVYEFVSTVLEHSAILGLRGEITGQYLQKLGFISEKDFTVIGCPSLYMYGNSIKIRDIIPTIEKLAFNTNTLAPREISDFLVNSCHAFPTAYLIQQKQKELRNMYLGGNEFGVEHIFSEEEFTTLNQEDKIRFFIDVPKWIQFMKDVDLFIGDRFHGTVAAVLAGTPHVIIPFDARTRELAEYHHLTHLYGSDIKPQTSILDYLDKLDFSSFEKTQNKNLSHYVDFLQKNKLENAFDESFALPMGTSSMEKRIKEVQLDQESVNAWQCGEVLEDSKKKQRMWIYRSERFAPQ